MASQTELCNGAMDMISANTISDINENSTAGKACKRHFDRCRDELLAMHPWTFAKAIRSLNRLAGVATGKWGYAYQLPSDTISVVGFADDPEARIKYEVMENSILLTDHEAAEIIIIRRVNDPAKFSSHFTLAFVPMLASRIAYKITRSRSLRDASLNEFMKMLDIAASADSQQENSPDLSSHSDWIDARF